MASRVYRARRGRPGREETHERILQTVRELLAEGTFHDATVETIAARAGVARSTLNLHFGSRMGLIDSICGYLAETADYAEIQSALGQPDPADAMRRVIVASVRFWAADERMHRGLYGLAEIDPAARAYVDRQTTERHNELRRLVRRLRDAGLIQTEISDSEALGLLLVATSFGTFDELRRNARLDTTAIEHAVLSLATVLTPES